MKKRILAFLLTAAICAAAFAGCGNDGNTSSKESSTPVVSTGSGEAEKDPLGADFAGYPLEGDNELSFYALLSFAYAAPDGVALNDNEFEKGLAERTGIKVDWIQMPAGADSSQSYQLMLVSNELPDIFYKSGVPSSVTQLIDDKKVVPLNDYLETYAPAYYKVATSSEEMSRALKNDNGDYYGFMFLREDLYLGTYAGPIIRQDLLDQLGMAVPETIEDWDTVLTAMKDQNLVKYPFSARSGISDLLNPFAGAYDTTGSFYVEDGKVHYGWAEEGMKEFAALMNKWYEAGILDPDFLANDSNALETKILNGEVGSANSSGNTLMGYLTKMEAIGSKETWSAAPYAVLNKGDTPDFTQGEVNNIGFGGVITTSCKNIPLACRFLDYGYTDEGKLYYNYGDESNYEIVDGVPRFTEAFSNDTRGMSTMLKTYTGMDGNSATLHMLASFKSKPQVQQDAVDTWYVPEGLTHILPYSLTMSTDESESIATEAAAIDANVNEMISKFILGQESLDNWDSFVATLNSMGLEHVLEVRQTVYDRYLNR